jgi:hypothetical protein
MLSGKQKKAYVKSGGVRCPYCQSQDIEAGKGVFDTGIAWLTVTCNACQEQWHEIFHLKTIHALDAGNGSRTLGSLRLPHEEKPISFVRLLDKSNFHF